jgi:hypothetical protein
LQLKLLKERFRGERDPLKEIGVDAAKLGVSVVAEQLIPKALAKALLGAYQSKEDSRVLASSDPTTMCSTALERSNFPALSS